MSSNTDIDKNEPAPPRTADVELLNFGKRFVIQMNILLKMAQIHQVQNSSFDSPVSNLMSVLELCFAHDDSMTIARERDTLFLNEEKLKMDIETFSSFSNFMDALAQRKIGKINFLKTVTGQDLRNFIVLFNSVDIKSDPEPFQTFQSSLEKFPLESIKIEEYIEKKGIDLSSNVHKGSKEFAKKTYMNTVSAVNQVMESAKLNQAVSMKRTKRLVQSMVDLILQEESVLLGLTNLRCYDEYTYHHSVNVCILSLGMGQRLGYDKIELSNLGMASLFHDIGKANVPVDLLNKPTDFDDEEWKIIRRHPILGVRNILKMKGLNELAIKTMYGSFEHHLNYDNSGYPKLAEKRKLSLFGRIISTADCYDAMTSSRVYNRIPIPPDRALQLMLKKSGTAFDPVLIKVFVNCIGSFPIGTLVLLDTSEIAVVVQTHPDSDKGDRPKVKIIVTKSGQEMIDGEVVDLSETLTGARDFKRSILRTIDPHKYKVDVSRYFI
ncbi:MAG: HD-GYP domain-containing protein [Nitrospirae bacterium]|nr:HD-GYP domain-containing protein [Nitrospirota bacterium]MBI3595245.1 HD-GYP domain-containing protein [Nitrospirota bacterium]